MENENCKKEIRSDDHVYFIDKAGLLNFNIKEASGFEQAMAWMNQFLSSTFGSINKERVAIANERALHSLESKKEKFNLRLPQKTGVMSWNTPIMGRISFIGSSAEALYFLKGYTSKDQLLLRVDWEIEFPGSPQELRFWRTQVCTQAKERMIELHMKVSTLFSELNDLEAVILHQKKGEARNNMVGRYRETSARIREVTGTKFQGKRFQISNLKVESILPDDLEMMSQAI